MLHALAHRPPAILWFDGVMVLSCLLGLIDVALAWTETMAALAAIPEFADHGLVEILAIGVLAIAYGAVVLPWMFVSLRASKVAKWLLAAMALLSLALAALSVIESGIGLVWLNLASNLALGAATLILFLPAAARWFDPQVAPDVFG